VLQGAHFVSHNLWSALICWLVVLALYEVLLRRAPRPKGD
jgi:membrane-associated PAP2 superfamily phosphatase